jgi:pyruvate carboxylase
VVEGVHVEIGQPVAFIEAMKMEATITATQAGVVHRIAIGKNQAVESGDLILVIENK